jgi:hypothetical protein
MLKEADGLFEKRLRRLIKALIRQKHTPLNVDLSPIKDFFSDLKDVYWASSRRDEAQIRRSTEALNRFSSDPHYKQRDQLAEALDIADKIQIGSLFDLYQATKTSNLSRILPGWRKMIQPPIRYIARAKKRDARRQFGG